MKHYFPSVDNLCTEIRRLKYNLSRFMEFESAAAFWIETNFSKTNNRN